MEMHHVRRGGGEPLLLLHGLGGSWREWGPVIEYLAAEREVIAVDLPGFGEIPPLPDEGMTGLRGRGCLAARGCWKATSGTSR